MHVLGVWVVQVARVRESAIKYLCQRRLYLVCRFGVEHAGACQAVAMRDAGPDVNFEQPAVEPERAIEFSEARIRFALESTSPKCFCLLAHKLSIVPATNSAGNWNKCPTNFSLSPKLRQAKACRTSSCTTPQLDACRITGLVYASMQIKCNYSAS